MTDLRAEQYPILPPVDWASTEAQRLHRRAALDTRNDLIRTGGTDAAVAVVKGGSIGAGKTKEAKKP